MWLIAVTKAQQVGKKHESFKDSEGALSFLSHHFCQSKSYCHTQSQEAGRCPLLLMGETAKPWAKGMGSGRGDRPQPLNAVCSSSQSWPAQFMPLLRDKYLCPILHIRSPKSHLIRASGLNLGSCGFHPTEAPLSRSHTLGLNDKLLASHVLSIRGETESA